MVDAITAEVLAGYVLLLRHALADREASTPALVRALFEWMGRGIQDNARFYRAIFREIAKISLGLDEGGEAQAQRRAATDLLRQLHLRGQARGDLTRAQPAEDLASAFDGLVFGTIIHWLYEDQRESLEARMGRAAELLLAGIAGERTRGATSKPVAPPPEVMQRPRRRARAALRSGRKRR